MSSRTAPLASTFSSTLRLFSDGFMRQPRRKGEAGERSRDGALAGGPGMRRRALRAKGEREALPGPLAAAAAAARRAGSALVAAHQLGGHEHVAGESLVELVPPGAEADIELGVEGVQ